MPSDLNPKVVKTARWFLLCAGLLWLLVAFAAWSTSAAVSVCMGGLGVALLLIAMFGSNYVARALRYFNRKGP